MRLCRPAVLVLAALAAPSGVWGCRRDAPARAAPRDDAGEVRDAAADVAPDAAAGKGDDAAEGTGEVEAAAPAPAVRTPGDGFRSFRAGRYRTGRATGRAPRAPVLLWEREVGGELRAQPVIAADGAILVASLAGTLAAFSASGERLWSFEAGDRIYSTPWIADDGTVIFGADTDALYGLRPDGRVRWAILPAQDTEKPELHDVDTAPVAAGNAGFVGAGLYVYGFDLRGSVRWRTATGGKVFSSPALLPDGTVVVGSQDDKLWALRPAGAVRWTYATAADLDGTPAVDELPETIYVGGDDGKVHAVTFGGDARWTTDVGGFVRTGVAVDVEGRVYATTFGPTARLVALDPDGGWVRWTVAAGTGPTAEYGVRSSPIVDADGVVLFGAPGGSVRAVSPDGEPLWTFPAPDDVDAGPILAADGTVIFGCDDGKVRAIGDAAAADDVDIGGGGD